MTVTRAPTRVGKKIMKGARKSHIASYRATYVRAWLEATLSFAPFLVLLISHERYINRLTFVTISPFVFTRLFVVFHDACHGSFFPSPTLNTWLWRILSICVMSPGNWKDDHHLHHSYGGNIDNKLEYQWNSTVALSRQEIQQLRPAVLRSAYRFFRHPVVYFPVASFYEWFIRFRIPIVFDGTCGYSGYDNMKNTAALLSFFFILSSIKGSYSIAIDYALGFYLAGVGGFALFHAQHSFEDGYVEHSKDWNFTDAAFKGSSFVDAPWFLRWSMMGIGYHHIHHYDPKVPGYLLKQCHDEGDPTFWEDVAILDMRNRSFWNCLALTTYDEGSGKYIK